MLGMLGLPVMTGILRIPGTPGTPGITETRVMTKIPGMKLKLKLNCHEFQECLECVKCLDCADFLKYL